MSPSFMRTKTPQLINSTELQARDRPPCCPLGHMKLASAVSSAGILAQFDPKYLCYDPNGHVPFHHLGTRRKDTDQKLGIGPHDNTACWHLELGILASKTKKNTPQLCAKLPDCGRLTETHRDHGSLLRPGNDTPGRTYVYHAPEPKFKPPVPTAGGKLHKQ